jgi:hypothetical protein
VLEDMPTVIRTIRKLRKRVKDMEAAMQAAERRITNLEREVMRLLPVVEEDLFADPVRAPTPPAPPASELTPLWLWFRDLPDAESVKRIHVNDAMLVRDFKDMIAADLSLTPPLQGHNLAVLDDSGEQWNDDKCIGDYEAYDDVIRVLFV